MPQSALDDLDRYIQGRTALTAERLNMTVDQLNLLNRDVRSGRTFINGMDLQWGIPMRVKEIFNDYLRCRLWDGTTEGDVDYYVAKPVQLRHEKTYYHKLNSDGTTTVLDSLTTVHVQRVTAVQGADTETWDVNLCYFADCQIRAIIPSSGTNLEASLPPDGGGRGQNTTRPLLYEDANYDGRKWGVLE